MEQILPEANRRHGTGVGSPFHSLLKPSYYIYEHKRGISAHSFGHHLVEREREREREREERETYCKNIFEPKMVSYGCICTCT
ncbi:unnamed protein product [Musa acuminata subsp. malaccensis]|uniref:(wild Malaysian banana) hypothetical protein n=1 Tax=Musa acuminata subsp. malaccensis TaxID=214687 RepID=A0A804J3L3_MUSAM|nr:unnamed protein product [Musa acuminata subsp. malaccensis]